MVLTNHNQANKTPFYYYYWWEEYEEIQIDYTLYYVRKEEINRTKLTKVSIIKDNCFR